MTQRMSSAWVWPLAIAAALLAGAYLRISGIGGPSLWEDELFSADIILNRPVLPHDGAALFERIPLWETGSSESFWTIKAADQSPPAYELAGKALLPIFGDSEAGLRAGSALASLTFLIWLGWRIWRHRATAPGMVYATALLMCVSCAMMVFYAQEVRAYSLGGAFAGVITVLFLERTLDGWRRARLPAWPEICLFIGAALTHYNLTALCALILAAYSVEALRRRDWYALLRMACVLAAVLSWLFLNYHSLTATTQGRFGWVSKPSYGQALITGLRSLKDGVLGPQLASTMAVTVLVAACLLLPTWLHRKRPSRQPPVSAFPPESIMTSALALAALVSVYFVLATLIMRKSGIVHVRHYLFLLPAVYLLFGLAIAQIWQRARWLAWGLLAVAVVSQWPMMESFRSIHKVNHRLAAAIAMEHLRDGDVVLTDFMLNPAGHRYYLERRANKSLVLHTYRRPSDACAAVQGRARFGFVRHIAFDDLTQALQQACGQGYRIQKFDADGMLFELWESATPSP